MVTFSYNEQKDYLETFFNDKTTTAEVINYLKEIRKKTDYPKNLKILINSKNGKLVINPISLKQILEENIKLFSVFSTLKVGIVIDKPVDTALAVIYTRLIQLEKYQFHVFNTFEAAELWICKGNNNRNQLFPQNPIPKNAV